MSLLLVIAGLLLFYFLGYKNWSAKIAKKVFGLSGDESVPAHNPDLRDEIDFLPVKKHLLWGHHYTSIAGAAPIIGPAVAVFWGWMPALFWVIFGTIFIGAVHDFGALVLSVRHEGKAMGDIAGIVIHPRVRLLFQIIIYFLIWIVLTVFGIAIGVLFSKYPSTVIPVNFEIVVAMVMGYLFHKKKVGLLIPSLIALVGLYLMVGVGIAFPVPLKIFLINNDPIVTWAILLLIYGGIASVLPVWLLLQPRDYINSHQLVVGLGFLFVGLAVMHPAMSAPAINLHPDGAPPLFPFIFVTIACGAISGFHGLVASGTTSKQLNNMMDARAIGYGGMLGEGCLALIATVAVAAGLQNWGEHYHSFNTNGINAIANFVMGAGEFLKALHFPENWAFTLIAVLVISFAATSMDTAARIQRMLVSEIGENLKLPFLKNRYLAAILAIGPAVPLIIIGKKAWGPLWMLFGTTNQLIGALTLLTIFIYLFKNKRPVWYIAIPMVFLVLITTGAMVLNLVKWISSLGTQSSTSIVTIIIGSLILLLEIWMIIESILVLRQLKKEPSS